MPKKKKKTLLWRIHAEGMPHPSYLFGTMHVKDGRIFKLVSSIEQNIASCNTYAAEYNLDDSLSKPAQSSFLLPENMLLSDLLGKKSYRKLEKLFFNQTGNHLASFNNRNPFFIISVLTESYYNSEMPYPLDIHLYLQAKSMGKSVTGIESFEEQIDIMQKIPLKDQIKTLQWIIKHPGRFKKQNEKAVTYYLNQDIFTLYKTLKKGALGMRRIMIYDRNKLMAERIAKMVKSDSVFVSIGAGHLSGGKGVLRLLKYHGLKIEPVKLLPVLTNSDISALS